MNYALIAAELHAGYNSGKYDRDQYRTMIAALNRRYAKQRKKAGRTIDNRKRAA